MVSDSLMASFPRLQFIPVLDVDYNLGFCIVYSRSICRELRYKHSGEMNPLANETGRGLRGCFKADFCRYGPNVRSSSQEYLYWMSPH